MKSDLAQIRRTWSLLYPAGGVIELRVIRGRGTGVTSGFFDNSESLVRAIQTLNGHAVGAYVTLSRVNPPLFSRMANRAQFPGPAGAKDTDIPVRDNLLFDFDAVRPSDISATEAEHAAGIARARMALEWLQEEYGWPMGVVVDSGNGGHLLFRIALPNNQESTELVKRVLKAVSARFSDGVVVVDESVFNASRITKLPGTWACKGDSTPDRPHRQAAILSAPEALVEVTREQLEAVAAVAPEEPETRNTGNPRSTPFNIEGWMTEYHLPWRPGVPWEGGTKYILEECPYNPDHRAPDSAVFQFASGALKFRCLHNSCSQYDWRELRSKFERPAQHQNAKPVRGIRPAPAFHSGREVFEYNDEPVTPVIENLLYPGFTLLTGRPKSGKSWLSLQAAIAVARGRPLAGWLTVPKPGRVLYVALEEPRRRTTSRMRSLYGDDEPTDALDNIRFVYRVPPMLTGGLDELDAMLAEWHADLIVVDTVRAFVQSRERANESIVEADYRISNLLREAAQKHHCALVGVDHSRKAGGDVIDAVIGTSGVTAGCDSVIGLTRTLQGDTILTARGREHEELTYAMRFSGTAGDFGWRIHGSGDDAALSEERQDILELLKHEAPLTPARIALLLRKNANAVRRLISKLAGDGKIVKQGGAYILESKR